MYTLAHKERTALYVPLLIPMYIGRAWNRQMANVFPLSVNDGTHSRTQQAMRIFAPCQVSAGSGEKAVSPKL